MANISTLTVSLVTETAKFDSGLRKSRKTAEGFGRAMKGIGLAAGAALTGVGIAIGGLVKESLAVVDAQRKMARTLGTSQATFSGLALAAQISGVEVAAFGKAMTRQAKSISDANDGLQTQARAFDRLGLNTKALLELPVDKQFNAITKALGNVENATLKVAIASDIYGARNAQLINTLELGEEGLQGFIDKANELGVALTDRQTDAIEKANDAWTIFKTSLSGLGNQLAASLAPAIVTVAEKLTSLVATITNALPTFTAWATSILGVRRELQTLTVAELTAEILQLDEDIVELQNHIADVERSFKFLGEGDQARVAEDLAKLNAELDGMVKRWNDAIRARSELKKQGEINVGTPTGLDTDADLTIDRVTAALERNTKGWAAAKASIAETIGVFDDWEREANNLFTSTRTPVEAFRIEVDRIRKNPFVDADLQDRAIKDAIGRLHAALDAAKEKIDEDNKQISEFAIQGFRDMQSGLSDFLFDPWGDGLDDMGDRFKDLLRRMLADLAASKLLESFFGGLGSLFGFDTSGIFGGRAIGGGVQRGVSKVVGENGPEVFTPGASGQIRPLGAAQFSFVTNINGGGGDGLSLRTLIPILEERDRMLMAEFVDKLDRGAF